MIPNDRSYFLGGGPFMVNLEIVYYCFTNISDWSTTEINDIQYIHNSDTWIIPYTK